MRVVVIGGTGHIGTHLVPSLVRGGHDVVVVSRGNRKPYAADEAWSCVEMLTCNRTQAETDGTFAPIIAARRPDAVVDLTCFTVEQAAHLVSALDGQHLVSTGSIWAWGRSVIIPMTEESPQRPLGTYGTHKAALEHYLLREQQKVPATMVHPGHISGPGWPAINPAGNLDLNVYRSLKRDGSATLPLDGMGLLQHVHASDVAEVHRLALENRQESAGEAFNAVAEQSLTLRGYAELVAHHFGHEPNLTFLPWDEFASAAGEENARLTAEHIRHSPHHCMDKARRLLDFAPRHSAADTVLSALDALVDI